MAKHHSPRFLALVEDAKERIREISPGKLKRKLETESGFHLVDVREAEEFTAGHLPRAKHLCKGIIERDIEAGVPDFGAEIVLYGGGFRPHFLPTTCRGWATSACSRSPEAGASGLGRDSQWESSEQVAWHTRRIGSIILQFVRGIDR